MSASIDGPHSTRFVPIPLIGNAKWSALDEAGASPEMAQASRQAPTGDCVCWGIPFAVGDPVVVAEQTVELDLAPCQADWFVFMHTSDQRPTLWNEDGLITASPGVGRLNEHAATYIIVYEDGSEACLPIRRRHQLGAYQRIWGENCFQSVPHHKPVAMRAHHEQMAESWGRSQYRLQTRDDGPWMNWLWAWQNPHSHKTVVGLRCEPVSLDARRSWRCLRAVLLTLRGMRRDCSIRSSSIRA